MVAGLQLTTPDKTLPIPKEIANWVERTPYRSLVGSLMYIAVGTRPDISYAVGRLSAFLDCYRLEHWEAAICVVWYLKGTRTLGLILRGPNNLELIGYSDLDYANCIETSRSVAGYCFTLGSGMVSWRSRKGQTMADSTCYAEYMALHKAAQEAMFLGEMLTKLKFKSSKATLVLCDNNAAIILSEDHIGHPQVKHIRVKYHYVQEQVRDGYMVVRRVRSEDNTADILTKPLGCVDFQRLRGFLGLRNQLTGGV
jgi:hypothetical protein